MQIKNLILFFVITVLCGSPLFGMNKTQADGHDAPSNEQKELDLGYNSDKELEFWNDSDDEEDDKAVETFSGHVHQDSNVARSRRYGNLYNAQLNAQLDDRLVHVYVPNQALLVSPLEDIIQDAMFFLSSLRRGSGP